MLLVDHDVPFVLDVCHPVYVLDFGDGHRRGRPPRRIRVQTRRWPTPTSARATTHRGDAA